MIDSMEFIISATVFISRIVWVTQKCAIRYFWFVGFTFQLLWWFFSANWRYYFCYWPMEIGFYAIGFSSANQLFGSFARVISHFVCSGAPFAAKEPWWLFLMSVQSSAQISSQAYFKGSIINPTQKTIYHSWTFDKQWSSAFKFFMITSTPISNIWQKFLIKLQDNDNSFSCPAKLGLDAELSPVDTKDQNGGVKIFILRQSDLPLPETNCESRYFRFRTFDSSSHVFLRSLCTIRGPRQQIRIFFFRMSHSESLCSKRDDHFVDEIENKTISIQFLTKKISFCIEAWNSTCRPQIAHLFIWEQRSRNIRR